MTQSRLLKVAGSKMSTTDGLKICKDLGMKLIELRSKRDVSDVLNELKDVDIITPSASYYNTDLRTYVFFIDDLPLMDHSAIQLTSSGYKIDYFDSYDCYQTYYGQYAIEGLHVFQKFVKSKHNMTTFSVREK